MFSVRWQTGGLFLTLVCGLLAFASPASAQFGLSKDSRIEVKDLSSDAKIKLREMQRGTLRVKGPEYKSNQAIMKQSAEYYIYRVTHEEYYDPISRGDLRARPENRSVEGLVRDLTSTLLVPKPDNSAKYTLDQGDYITEYGEALDNAVRAVLTKNPPLLIRTNVARLLSVSASSGAVAHAKTIQELLNHKFFKAGDKFLQTPPEVYYYALKAAENLLAAYRPVWHLDASKATLHTLRDDDLIPLVKLLETIVLQGPTIMSSAYSGEASQSPMTTPATAPPTAVTPPTGATTPPIAATTPPAPATLTPEQAKVYEFYRRQAVRALSKVRFDIIGQGTPNEIRPGFTVARVAVSDFSIVPAPSTAEISEAVMGLINLTPSSNLRIDEWAYVIARGTELMIAPKLESEENQTLQWRLTAARFNVALDQLKKTAPNNPRMRPFKDSIVKLCDVITSSIMNPLEKDDPTGAVKPSRDQLAGWMSQNPPKDPNRSLFDDKPNYSLTSRQSR